MTTASFLCRHPTWTRLFVLVGTSVAFIETNGCSFADYSKSSNQSPTLTQACAESSALSPDAATPEGLVAHWAFDDDDPGTAPPTWLDTQEQRKLVLGPNRSSAAAALTRLNGHGHALLLDGNTFAQSDNDETLFPDVSAGPGFTISAWISLRLEDFKSANAGDTRIWPIISTLGIAEHCGGYQLDVRSESNIDGPILAISFEYPATGDAGAACSPPNVLKIPLRTPSWSWGFGRWHHIVATYTKLDQEQAALALFWDGTRLATDTPASSTYDGSITFTDHTLYVGSNGRVGTSTDGTSNYKGHIDDVSLFNRVLSDNEISTFSLASSTFPGPSNCRWNALEQWDFDAGSLSTWKPNPTPTSATLNVNDLYWGAGFLSARLLPEKDLGLFDTAYLTADVPRGTSNPPRPFEFSISSGDDSCSWMLQANGADRYVIDLTRPSFCVSTSCSFKPNRVQWARVQSEWASPEGPFDITVTRLEFDRRASTSAESLPLGGSIGPEGWCWRPQAYNPNALASWAGQDASFPSSVSSVFTGGPNTTVRIMADFGDQLLDLTHCDHVKIDADLPKLADPYAFNFALIDARGAVVNWNLYKLDNPMSVSLKTVPDYDSFGKVEFPDVPRFTFSQVVQLGIEKPFAYATSANSPLLVNIRSIRFFDDKGRQGCEIPTKR